jgi:hypothetical protein
VANARIDADAILPGHRLPWCPWRGAVGGVGCSVFLSLILALFVPPFHDGLHAILNIFEKRTEGFSVPLFHFSQRKRFKDIALHVALL